MESPLVNLFGVSVGVRRPVVLGFFPRLRLPAIVAEIVVGIVLVGPRCSTGSRSTTLSADGHARGRVPALPRWPRARFGRSPR